MIYDTKADCPFDFKSANLLAIRDIIILFLGLKNLCCKNEVISSAGLLDLSPNQTIDASNINLKVENHGF